MDRTGREVSCHTIPHYSKGWRCGSSYYFALLCTMCIVLSASEASSQCAARHVPPNQLEREKTLSATTPPSLVGSAVAVPVWKTITVGTFATSFALRDALDAAGCAIGDLAGQILARPAFTLSAVRTDVELLVVSPAELGFQIDTASLADVYTRAQQLGFGLAAAEVAPQLRLQYFDQSIGEFVIGMEPMKTWTGTPVILSVANGGAGLVLIGRDGGAGAKIPVATRFLFVRSNEADIAKAGQGPDEAAVLVHR